MYKVAWCLICEKIITDQSGKNSYIAVFDRVTIRRTIPEGESQLAFPLAEPAPGPSLGVAFYVLGDPGEPEFEFVLKDPDNQSILGPARIKMDRNPDGKFNVHINLQNGFLIRKSGVFSFFLRYDGKEIGCGELQVSVTIEEEKKR